jgi:hypothetical protein
MKPDRLCMICKNCLYTSSLYDTFSTLQKEVH